MVEEHKAPLQDTRRVEVSSLTSVAPEPSEGAQRSDAPSSSSQHTRAPQPRLSRVPCGTPDHTDQPWAHLDDGEHMGLLGTTTVLRSTSYYTSHDGHSKKASHGVNSVSSRIVLVLSRGWCHDYPSQTVVDATRALSALRTCH